MIEFALLFGLGFLSAALVAMLLAPSIHRRIVRFTENRLRATIPLSPQEIRAQKDMVRALYAAENARTTQELLREREKAMALQLQNDTLAREASRLVADNQELQVAAEAMEVEAGELRSKARRYENDAISLTELVKRLEETAAAKDLELEQLLARLQRVGHEIDNLKIESSARETEIENLKQRVQSLRDEREELRREVRLTTQRAKDAEQRLIQEEHTRIRLDDRLARQMADNADKDLLIERRTQEAARLADRLKDANRAVRAATRALKSAKIPVPQAAEGDFEEMPLMIDPSPKARPQEMAADIERMTDELRHRQTALTDQLARAGGSANDDALREEIADIAARMIVLTAMKEGKTSPVNEIFATQTTQQEKGTRLTLAERARKMKAARELRTS